jgi:hypothetical protein
MPDEPLDQRLQLVISKGQVAALDEWRRHQPDLPSRSAAIRRLIELGLGKAPTSRPSGGSTPGSTRKPASTGKAAPRAKKPGKSTPTPKAKALGMSKEAQIRALREQGTG